ncbi:hypothetical protein OK074_8503, partial [Actinobacteria bacterium OK074]
MPGLRSQRLAARRARHRRAARRGVLVAAASAVVAVGSAAGMMSALADGHADDTAHPAVTTSAASPHHTPALPSPSPDP